MSHVHNFRVRWDLSIHYYGRRSHDHGRLEITLKAKVRVPIKPPPKLDYRAWSQDRGMIKRFDRVFEAKQHGTTSTGLDNIPPELIPSQVNQHDIEPEALVKTQSYFNIDDNKEWQIALSSGCILAPQTPRKHPPRPKTTRRRRWPCQIRAEKQS